MAKISAFVAHSFEDEDKMLIDKFLRYLNAFRHLGFEWEDAEEAESEGLANKVKAKMEGKNAFVGIFTKKYPVDRWFKTRRNFLNILMKAVPCILKPKSLLRNIKYCASSWIFQESGYAICKETKLLFLVEEGIIDIGGLQGQLEYVPFLRETPEKSFPKINQIINKWMGEEYKEFEKPLTAVELPKKRKEEAKAEEKALLRIYQTIFIEKDAEKAEELICDYIDGIGDIYEKIRIRAKFLSAEINVGLKPVTDLVKLSEENEEHPEPIALIGYQYGRLGRFDKAAEKFLEARGKESSNIGKISRICSAAEYFGKGKEYKRAFTIILNELKCPDLEDECKSKLYGTMASIFEMEKADDQRICFMEKALEIDPFDYSLRFNLAYEYSEIGKQNLALYHYKKVVSGRPSTGSWNNLGVCYDALDFHGKTVKAYGESKNLNGTLAMANLANRYIDGGFFEEAEEILDGAVKIENYDPLVAEAKTRVEKLKKEEENKEKEILESYEPYGSFYRSYCDAYIDEQIDEGILDGRWKTKHGEVEIKQTTNNFQGHGRYEEVDKLTTAILGEKGKVYKKYRMIKLTGSITGRCVKYELKIEESSDIDKSKKESAFTGLLIIDKDYNLIKALEKDNAGKETFYDLVRI